MNGPKSQEPAPSVSAEVAEGRPAERTRPQPAPAGSGRLRIAVTGSTGLIGTRLTEKLKAGGHSILRIVRRKPAAADEIFWDPPHGVIDSVSLEGVQAVVHLAGENLGGGWWTAARKRRILESRTQGTGLLARSLAGLERPPAVLVSASAVGYYGDQGDAPITEESPAGTTFLARVCQAWESATDPAGAREIRVVRLRFGVVLDAAGGVLPKMLLPYRLGVGGPIGSGRQYLSWIALEDLCAVIERAILDPELGGAVNAGAPNPVTQRELARTTGRVLRRPAFFRLPAWAVRLLLGQMGEEMLLASARMVPARLEEAGFRFIHPDYESALRHVLAGERRAYSQ